LLVFKTKTFARFARKANLEDAALCEAIANAERGLSMQISEAASLNNVLPDEAKGNQVVSE